MHDSPPPRHAIHLGAAWEPPARDRQGGLVWRRRFGRPAGVGPCQAVMLVVSGGRVPVGVAVNGVHLAAVPADVGRWEAEVGSLLRDRNELEVVTADDVGTAAAARRGSGPLPHLFGRVTLEIVGEPPRLVSDPGFGGNA